MDTRELALQSAIDDLRAGVFTSQRKAAKAHGVPRSTLQERINGRQPSAIAHSSQQRLTPEQEAFLVDWILDEDSYAQPPSRPRVREMATRILHMNGDYEPLGQLWVPHFIARNPRVASIVSRTSKSARTTSASSEITRAFLGLFERTRIELGIQYEDIWKMYETEAAHPNERFSNVESFKAAIDHAAALKAQQTAKSPEEEAQKAAAAAAALTLDSMCTEWQI